MSKIKFGTDGWRAVIAKEFTFENVRKVSQAIADYVNSSKSSAFSSQLIIGYDCRFMSDIYAKIVAEVIAANGIKVLLVEKPTPTPAISFAIKRKGLSGGIIITASHNPPQFNGMKFKTELATSANEEITEKIESLIGKRRAKSVDLESAIKKGKIMPIDVKNDYVNFIKRYIDLESIKNSKGLNILIDYMHGAGAGYIEAILEGSGVKLERSRGEVNPFFGGINPEPIPKNLKASIDYLKEKKFSLCVALDGDADRIGAIAPDGRYITSGQIISLLLLHFLEIRGVRGSVAKTISGTTLIERICEKFKLTMYELPVGFKYIAALMMKEDIIIGGEESGGIGYCGYIPERDGILSALLLIEMLAVKRKGIDSIMRAIEKRFGSFCYDRIDLKYPKAKAIKLNKKLKSKPPRMITKKKVLRMKTYDGIKFILEDSSWLLLRFSGTEPLIRIYAEAGSDAGVKRLLSAGKRLIGKK